MKTPFFGTLALFAALTIGCTENEETKETTIENPAPAVVVTEVVTSDWEGAFVGTLPCADCEGIRMAIYLNRDETYSQQMRYLGKDDKVFYANGRFEWNDQGNAVVLIPSDGSAKSNYQIGEGKIIKLDANGGQIKGDMPEMYMLNKIGVALDNTKWRLVEIDGKRIETAKSPEKEPFIMINTVQKTYSGFGACNRFAGTLKAFSETEMAFNHGPATLSDCPEMEIETKLFYALASAKTYTKAGNMFVLSGLDKVALAKFEAILVN